MANFQDKVVYQIYPKSFQDSNNDGFGDINGIIKHLDYLEKLGVDYIWLNPIFVSPQNDNGYDIEDYYAIDPSYGTMADLEKLISEAKKHNIYLMFDMVFNHTSTNHQWFKKALNGEQKYKDYYIFKKGKMVIRQLTGNLNLVVMPGNMSKNLMNITYIYLMKLRQI